MFFDGSTRSRAQDHERSPTISSSAAAASRVVGLARHLRERVRRRGRDCAANGARLAAGSEHLARRGAGTRAPTARCGTRPAPPASERAELLGDVGRAARRMPSGPQNGVCVKCTIAQVGPARAQHAGHERELVVLHEHDVAGRPRRRRPRRRTPRSPRRTRPTPRGTRRSKRGRRAQVEQAVEEEPQHAVRHDVVVQAVLVGVEVERGAGRRRDRRSSPGLGGAIVVGRHRGRDPRVRPSARRASSGPSALDDATGAAAARRTCRRRSRTNRYGPRCETTINGSCSGRRTGAASLRARASSGSCRARVSRPAAPIASARSGSASSSMRALRALLDGVDEVAVVRRRRICSVMPPARPPTTGRPFQSAFAHREAEALAQRLLQHDVGGALERVDLHRADLLDVREQVDVAVAGARLVR